MLKCAISKTTSFQPALPSCSLPSVLYGLVPVHSCAKRHESLSAWPSIRLSRVSSCHENFQYISCQTSGKAASGSCSCWSLRKSLHSHDVGLDQDNRFFGFGSASLAPPTWSTSVNRCHTRASLSLAPGIGSMSSYVHHELWSSTNYEAPSLCQLAAGLAAVLHRLRSRCTSYHFTPPT